MADPKTQTACEENPKVGFGPYIALALAIIIFSGVFYKMPDAYKWLGAFDYIQKPFTEEHLLPLHVAAGAAGEGRGAKVFGDRVMGVDISAFRFD